jgi:hypothetical protein
VGEAHTASAALVVAAAFRSYGFKTADEFESGFRGALEQLEAAPQQRRYGTYGLGTPRRYPP